MMPNEYLSDDGQVVLALCSAFGLTDGEAAGGLSPFKLAEWNELEKKIAASSFKRPVELPGRRAD